MSKLRRKADKRIEDAFYKTCVGAQINVLDIGKVFAAGYKAIDAGADDAALEKAIVAFVETIRRN
jgi:hypothetical protein